MTQPYYECHITFNGSSNIGKKVTESIRWKHSQIDGDPIMGEGIRQYATKHFNQRRDKNEIWKEMEQAKLILTGASLQVTRMKIEKVLQDERY